MTGSSATTGEPAPNSPEWQLTLDVIKNKTMVLMEQNAKLIEEHNSLVKAYKKAQMDKRDLELQNESMRQFLRDRHGRSEQQMRMEEVSGQIRTKEDNVRQLQKGLSDLQKDTFETERRLKLRKLKASEIELHVKIEASQEKAINVIDQRVALENDDDYNKLKAKLAQERAQEDDLQKQVDALKQQSLQPLVIPSAQEDADIKSLEQKIADLHKQKEDLQNRTNSDNNQRYLQLMDKKKELESKIKEFEAQLNQLKEPATFGFLDPRQKKQIIRQMAQIDSRNIQLRQKIADLKEDVTLLREQVGRLERRANGVQASEDNTK